MKKITLFFVILLGTYPSTKAQNLFNDDVKGIENTYANLPLDASPIVFTGSSSVRLWKNLALVFNNTNIINTGFGGSTAKDLLIFHKPLITRFKPAQVFIYEGDNDLFEGVSPRKVLATTKKIIRKIKRDNKETKIVLIAVKPSLSRWSLKDKYLKLNKKFQRFSHRKSQVSFADVWAPMLENKALKEDLFISDGLHMNQKGYQLWEQVIGPLILK